VGQLTPTVIEAGIFTGLPVRQHLEGRVHTLFEQPGRAETYKDFKVSTVNSIAPQQSVKEVKRVGRTACTSQLIAFMWDKLSNAGMLEEHELRWIAGIGEIVAMNAANLGAVVQGIGCLVASDAAAEPGSGDGSLQNGDSISELLFTISNAIEIIGQVTYAASEASGALRLTGANNHG
jgi:hypothetical protein